MIFKTLKNIINYVGLMGILSLHPIYGFEFQEPQDKLGSYSLSSSLEKAAHYSEKVYKITKSAYHGLMALGYVAGLGQTFVTKDSWSEWLPKISCYFAMGGSFSFKELCSSLKPVAPRAAKILSCLSEGLGAAVAPYYLFIIYNDLSQTEGREVALKEVLYQSLFHFCRYARTYMPHQTIRKAFAFAHELSLGLINMSVYKETYAPYALFYDYYQYSSDNKKFLPSSFTVFTLDKIFIGTALGLQTVYWISGCLKESLKWYLRRTAQAPKPL